VVIWGCDGGHGGAVIIGFLLCVRQIFIFRGYVQKTRMKMNPLRQAPTVPQFCTQSFLRGYVIGHGIMAGNISC
jgi:hypothetical protein